MNEIIQVLQVLCLIVLIWVASKQGYEIRKMKRFLSKFEDLSNKLSENNSVKMLSPFPLKGSLENQEYLRDCLKEIQNKK